MCRPILHLVKVEAMVAPSTGGGKRTIEQASGTSGDLETVSGVKEVLCYGTAVTVVPEPA